MAKTPTRSVRIADPTLDRARQALGLPRDTVPAQVIRAALDKVATDHDQHARVA